MTAPRDDRHPRMPDAPERPPLLSVRGLRTWIDAGEAVVRAVDGVSFDIARGETFALLGESGSGKSLTALSIMRLLPDAGQIVHGSVDLDGVDLLRLPEAQMRALRGRRIAMIFQEPMLALNPVMTVGEQIAEALRCHTSLAGAALQARVLALLDAARMPDAKRRRSDYPFQLSGGMKQRVMIAMALACDPELLIADEPTTALDVTIQAQILALMRELQRERGMSLLLITHDLAVVSEIAHRVAVMYAGEIVETAACEPFFAGPAHPYSRMLFHSVPTRERRQRALAVIPGLVPALTAEFAGCRFAGRCDAVQARCREAAPPWRTWGGGAGGARCHLLEEHRAPVGPSSTASPEALSLAPAPSPALRSVTPDPSPGWLPEPPHGQHTNPTPSGSAVGTGQNGSEQQEALPLLLEVRNLEVHFPIRKGILKRTVGAVKAVDGVSLDVAPGRTLGLVGESGCGKTTLGKGILRLVDPHRGSVQFAGTDLAALPHRALRPWRRRVQIIFQDPYASLDPRMRIAETLEEGMSALGVGRNSAERQARIDALLAEVGLAPDVKQRYPHEFSGGQRQRIAIARALSVEPQLIVCDEPTSALDVSVQAQILNLLKSLQVAKGLAYVFITHNISVVEYMAHEVAVMYLGRIVEHGPVDDVLGAPRHPYTRALLSAVPVMDPGSPRAVIHLEGDLPSPAAPPAGCHFHPRCSQAMPRCTDAYPDAASVGPRHTARCHLYGTEA